MSAVAVAIIGSAAVGAGVGIYAANQASDATEEAAEIQADTASENLALQEELANAQREDLAPWRDQGMLALEELNQGIKDGRFSMDNFDFTASPGYQFRLTEGIEALDKSASARGRLQSGAQQKAITNYAQNLASDEYARAYAREEAERVRDYNILANTSQTGQNAAAGQAGVTGNLAATSGNILSNLGANQANLAIQQGNIATQGAQNVAGAAQQGIQNWMTYQYLNS